MKVGGTIADARRYARRLEGIVRAGDFDISIDGEVHPPGYECRLAKEGKVAADAWEIEEWVRLREEGLYPVPARSH